MRINRNSVAVMSLVVFSSTAVFAADEPAKPTGPVLSDVLDASGITATGYVDGLFSYHSYSGGASGTKDYNAFTLPQAALTIAKQPAEGFGALVNVIAGAAAPGLPGGTGGSQGFDLLQAYAQYAGTGWTIIAGKFTTLAGAEVVAPTGNVNVTRSILFAYEPVTHTGVRATFTVNDKLSLMAGVNNGWVYSDEPGNGNDKTLEAGFTFAPSKAFSWAGAGYYGRDFNSSGTVTGHTLLDTVLTWNATSALSVVGSVDWAKVDKAGAAGSPSATWDGAALYLNFAINDAWRASLRGEYFQDKDGYLTATQFGQTGTPDNKLEEATLTFGYAPVKNFEVRLEGRYDTAKLPSPIKSANTTSAYVEALYKF
jgi:Putative beta-barrel porin-2, OmpL-like. bbp2